MTERACCGGWDVKVQGVGFRGCSRVKGFVSEGVAACFSSGVHMSFSLDSLKGVI